MRYVRIERGDDVLRRHFLAIVELHAFAQLEVPHLQCVVAWVPGFGQLALKIEVVVDPEQAIPHRTREQIDPVIGVLAVV
ncbi:hypothetical protein D3C87_2099120 [compost metagenome]